MNASNPETIYSAGSLDWTQARLITVSGIGAHCANETHTVSSFFLFLPFIREWSTCIPCAFFSQSAVREGWRHRSGVRTSAAHWSTECIALFSSAQKEKFLYKSNSWILLLYPIGLVGVMCCTTEPTGWSKKKRGHSTFSQISRKLLKISKWFFAHIKASVCRTWHIYTNFSDSFYSVAPSGEYWTIITNT